MNKLKISVNKWGSKHWFIDSVSHREGGPAFVSIEGDEFWYFNNRLHRIGGPAVTYFNGNRLWYFNGKFVRSDCAKQDRRTGI